jgi:hypothetical protein
LSPRFGDLAPVGYHVRVHSRKLAGSEGG